MHGNHAYFSLKELEVNVNIGLIHKTEFVTVDCPKISKSVCCLFCHGRTPGISFNILLFHNDYLHELFDISNGHLINRYGKVHLAIFLMLCSVDIFYFVNRFLL